MNKKCRQCGDDFEIPEEDLRFYASLKQEFAGEEFEMPAPSLCVSCRHQKRLSFRNEMFLYHRKCDMTGKQIISMYAPDKPYTVYDQQIWWSDKWDPMEYGRDFDFSRTFFEQFKDLQLEVPRMSLNNINAENSDYCNLSLNNRNSYLIYTADYNEDCAYCRFSDKNYSCFDCDYTYESSECYQCLNVEKCNRCSYSQKLFNCSGLSFCYDMIGCHDCIGCANLRNQQYCILNQKYSKEEYLQKKKALNLHTYSGMQEFRQQFEAFLEGQPRKALELMNCENSIGDHLRDCKNAQHCYNSVGLEDCKYMINCNYSKDCYDWDFVGYTGSEKCHEMASSAYNLVDCHFCYGCWEGGHRIFYSQLCLGNKELFGCIGLRKKEYCILNKQYEPEEYERMVAKIIAHMQETGEWGEFFSMDISTYGYNETVAYEYFPVEKEEALARGWRWMDDDSEKLYKGPDYQLPDDVRQSDEAVCKQILRCDVSGKPYKIIPQEYDFCKRIGVPLPRVSHRERHSARMALRNPWQLWDRQCQVCDKSIKSTYRPERPEPVYCEGCYKEAIYA